MSNRSPIAEVTRGCTTTSSKIRALAKAGYLRTEIAEALGVRYQHVRKVLVDAGVADGLSRGDVVKRPRVAASADDKTDLSVSESVLLDAGFRFLGDWRLLPNNEYELSVRAPSEIGVYAFVVDGLVVYIGLTQTGFHTRMEHYRRGHERQRTSWRIKNLIAEALAENRSVKVLIATPEQMTWNGLPVVTAAGLEAGLIRLIRPEWNMQGTRR